MPAPAPEQWRCQSASRRQTSGGALRFVKNAVPTPPYSQSCWRRASAASAILLRSPRMTTLHCLEFGFLAGIVMFFVLQRLGIIDRWIERLER